MWSQELYWYVYHVPLPVAHSAKVELVARMPGPGVAESAVLAAVRNLMLRHEALRTLYPTDPSGVPFQLVLDRFDVPPPFRREGDEPEDVEAVFDALVTPPMDQVAELPLRLGFTMRNGRVATLVLALNHISADGTSLPLLRADLGRWLGSPDAEHPSPADGRQAGTQPLALARQQRSGTHDSSHAKALRHCEEILFAAPAAQFPRFRSVRETDPLMAAGDPYQRVSLHSPQLFAALKRLCARPDFSASSRISTAFVIALSALSGNPRAVVRTTFSNRFREVRDSVGCFFQEALVAVHPLPHLTVAELMADTTLRIFDGVRHAQYSYLRFRDLKAQVEAQRGISVRMGTIFDCGDRFEEKLRSPDAPIWPAEARPRMKRCDWVMPEEYTDLLFKSYPMDGDVVLEVIAHKSVIDQDEIDALLTGVEQFLIAWADGPDLAGATVAEVVERFGLPKSHYGEGWAYADHSWVNTAKLARVLRSAEGVEAASVSVVERSPQEQVLLAHLVGTPSGQERVRAHVLAALREEADLMCPHEFVWCDELPEASRSTEPPTTISTSDSQTRHRAMLTALSAVLGDALVDLDSSYCQQGGSTVLAPAVVKHLAQLGFVGLTSDDLLGPWPLRAVAELCTPHDDSVAAMAPKNGSR
ncbi:Condensation domain-containing protein [Lentzea xinjiangensis]|uniref:Condensation domain-containing protein n=1 Tax=Lentzea xinjiangensis TaxID=402600 RepID=A0A1H9VZ00_9PSEU|nr:condensation domain-containing protein [Lentzea xinjiangensis]SES26872.1 Condensation domain-containing protein [Lentzea xinjiangensis]